LFYGILGFRNDQILSENPILLSYVISCLMIMHKLDLWKLSHDCNVNKDFLKFFAQTFPARHVVKN
jgi:hypothetical protein